MAIFVLASICDHHKRKTGLSAFYSCRCTVEKEKRKEVIEQAKQMILPIKENHQIHHSSNRDFGWPMMDHIFTDPPWKEMYHYQWLAEMAQEKVKKGGLVAVVSVQRFLDKLFPIFKGFNYVTTLAIVYKLTGVNAAGCFVPNWRPVLLFSNGKYKQPKDLVTDTVSVMSSPKDYHDWQQPLQPFVRWIEALTQPGDLIADPFAGAGTIPLACQMTGRRCVATEINEDMVKVGRMRLAA